MLFGTKLACKLVQRHPIADTVDRNRSMKNAFPRIGIDIEAFSDKGVHHPCALRFSTENQLGIGAVLKVRSGNRLRAAGKQARVIAQDNETNPLSIFRDVFGKSCLPLHARIGHGVALKESIAEAVTIFCTRWRVGFVDLVDEIHGPWPAPVLRIDKDDFVPGLS